MAASAMRFAVFAFCAALFLGSVNAARVATRGPYANDTMISSNWSDGLAKYKYTSGKGGQYSVTWSGDVGNFVVGKGYRPGGRREVLYSGNFSTTGNAYLALYGWTTNPLIEYYIVETYGTHRPTDTDDTTMKRLGNFTVDGGTYEIMTKMRINKPSIEGMKTFQQIFSVRNEKRVGGTITTGEHFDAWDKVGLKLGKQVSMVLATEGQNSTGSAVVNVGVAPAEGTGVPMKRRA